MTQRATWDSYFLDIAKTVATRATCDRKHVGAVIVRDKMILATGYNGSVRGLPHCDEVGHMMEDGHCTRVVHAESNALIQAARSGTRIDGAEIYVTASPCWPCFKLIATAGLKRIVFGEFYRDERIFEVAKALRIELVDANGPEVSLCLVCGTRIQQGTRYCEPHLAFWFDEPTEDGRADARRIFENQEAAGSVKVANGDGTLEWVKPELLRPVSHDPRVERVSFELKYDEGGRGTMVGIVIVLHLVGGCVVHVPESRSNRLLNASPDQRNNYKLIGGGTGIHWPELDEDLSVAGLLGP